MHNGTVFRGSFPKSYQKRINLARFFGEVLRFYSTSRPVTITPLSQFAEFCRPPNARAASRAHSRKRKAQRKRKSQKQQQQATTHRLPASLVLLPSLDPSFQSWTRAAASTAAAVRSAQSLASRPTHTPTDHTANVLSSFSCSAPARDGCGLAAAATQQQVDTSDALAAAASFTREPATTTASQSPPPQHLLPQLVVRTTAVVDLDKRGAVWFTEAQQTRAGAAGEDECVRVCVIMEEQPVAQQQKTSPTHGAVTPTETTAATTSASTSSMTPTKSSSESSLSLAGVNGADMMIEKALDASSGVTSAVSSLATPTASADTATAAVVATVTAASAHVATASVADASADSNGALASTSAFALPREVTQYSPLLVGKYYIQDKRAVWTGRWGMTEAAFEANGLTSLFEMKSQEDVYIATCAGEHANAVHPAFADGSLARSMLVENVTASEICPAYFGYETDSAVRSAMPFHSKYSGYFHIQATKGKPQMVPEKDVEIRFVHDPSLPSHFLVSGSGENRFGLFSLHGSLNKATSELRVYKVYKPREKEKRSLPRRGRIVKAAPQSSSIKVPIPQMPMPVAAAAVPTAALTAPAAIVVAAPIAAPVPTSRPSLAALPQRVSTPSAEYNLSLLTARGRSERKRVAPAHLREENMIEFDRVPHSVKKCHGILKGLMANPKAAPFMAPVDPVALGIPDYFHVIKEPMDLGTIRQNLEGGYYDDSDVFADHVRLVFRNAMLYNAAHSQVHIFAVKLLEDFEKRMTNLNLKMGAAATMAGGAGTPGMKDRHSFDKHKMMKSSKKEKRYESGHSTKKLKGGKGAKGNTKRRVSESDQGLIMSLKEDLERLKATLEQLQPSTLKIVTPKPSRPAARCVNDAVIRVACGDGWM